MAKIGELQINIKANLSWLDAFKLRLGGGEAIKGYYYKILEERHKREADKSQSIIITFNFKEQDVASKKHKLFTYDETMGHNI